MPYIISQSDFFLVKKVNFDISRKSYRRKYVLFLIINVEIIIIIILGFILDLTLRMFILSQPLNILASPVGFNSPLFNELQWMSSLIYVNT